MLLEVIPRKNILDAVVQPELSRITKLHDGHGSKQFGDRADAVDGAGSCADFFLEIRHPVASGPDDVLVSDYGRRNTGQMVVVALGLQPDVDEAESFGIIRLRFVPGSDGTRVDPEQKAKKTKNR